MTSKFNSNVGSIRAAKIARSDVVDINAYRKVKSQIYILVLLFYLGMSSYVPLCLGFLLL